jgi:hypothetical protein
MALNAAQTAQEMVAAENALPIDAPAIDRLTALVNVLYTRIKADIVITSQVASGITVAIPTTSSAGNPSTGATSAPGTATSQVVT